MSHRFSLSTLGPFVVALILVACGVGSPPPSATPLPTAAPPTVAPPTSTSRPAPTLTPVPNTPTALASAGPSATPLPAFTPAQLGKVVDNVTYCTVNGTPLQMDVYYPRALGSAPWPVAAYIHGGAMVTGDSSEFGQVIGDPTMTQAGFLQVSLNYRLGPQDKWPAQIEDVKCAIRHLRANAAHYHLDPRRVVAWGQSAGAQLAALLGLDDARAGWDVGQYLEQSSRVQAVVAFFGAYDLTQHLDIMDQVGEDAFGTTDIHSPILASASAITYVSASAAPIFLVQGTEDDIVPPSQAQEMYDRLTAAGAPVELLMVKHMGHSFQAVGGTLDPSLAHILHLSGQFFIDHLAP